MFVFADSVVFIPFSEFFMSSIMFFSAMFQEILLPSSGKVCVSVWGIHVFAEDKNIILTLFDMAFLLCCYCSDDHEMWHRYQA